MTPQYILTKSLCREPHCAHGDWKPRAIGEIENMNYAQGYAEPGYTDPAKGVLLADWNLFPSRIDDVLERAGFGIEWNDEWSTCADCGKLVRTSGDSYDWQPYYVIQNECELVCLDCADWESYLESIEDNPQSACMARCNPADYGYTLLSDSGEFENGFHPGQNDNPAKIHAALKAKGYSRLVFRIGETSQFYIKFEVWQKTDESDESDDSE